MFIGSFVANVTPFTEDGSQIDYEMLGELIDWHIESGTDGLMPAGCTGEAATLSHDEQAELIRFTVEKVAGRCKVIAGTGSNNTKEALRLTKIAKDVGADAALVITPYYNKPTAEGQYRHYKLLAEESGLPIMLYNVPGRTGTKMEASTIARLFNDCENVVSVKEACGSIDQICSIRAACDINILSGDDSLTLPMISVGASGVVSVLGNLMPREVKELCNAANSGHFTKAREIHYRLLPLMRVMFLESNPITIKAAMQMVGKCRAVTRMPMCEISEGAKAQLRSTLEAGGLL